MSDTLVTAWLLDAARPFRPPAEALVTIQRTARRDFAVLPNGRRFVIGTTAFLAKKPATQRWQGKLDKMRKDPYLRYKMPLTHARAEQLCTSHIYAGPNNYQRKTHESKQ